MQVPPDVVANMPTMSEAEYAKIQTQMRARFCAPTRENALTVYEEFLDTTPPPRPTPPPGRVFDAEWWEVHDEPEWEDDPMPALSYPQRRLAAPDDMPEVPQPKKRRRKRR